MVGESAGATLALTTGILSSQPRRWWKAPLCAIALSSPPLSYSHCSNRKGTFKTFEKNHVLESSLMEVFWKTYLGPGKSGSNWRASPLHTPKSRLQKLRRTPVHLSVAEVHTTHLCGVKTHTHTCCYLFNICFLLRYCSKRFFAMMSMKCTRCSLMRASNQP